MTVVILTSPHSAVGLTLNKMSIKVVLFLVCVVVINSLEIWDTKYQLKECIQNANASETTELYLFGDREDPKCKDFLNFIEQPEWVEEVHSSCFALKGLYNTTNGRLEKTEG